MARVTGIGGVFFKAKDPAKLKQWYLDHLGMRAEDWGGVLFRWADDQAATGASGVTVWHLAEEGGTWFAPSQASVMINYRVDDLAGLLADLAAKGVAPIKGPDDEFNGRFAWVMDPEGNKVELWEPKDP